MLRLRHLAVHDLPRAPLFSVSAVRVPERPKHRAQAGKPSFMRGWCEAGPAAWSSDHWVQPVTRPRTQARWATYSSCPRFSREACWLKPELPLPSFPLTGKFRMPTRAST